MKLDMGVFIIKKDCRPRAGAWIETDIKINTEFSREVAPARGRGLKLID